MKHVTTIENRIQLGGVAIKLNSGLIIYTENERHNTITIIAIVKSGFETNLGEPLTLGVRLFPHSIFSTLGFHQQDGVECNQSQII